MALKSPALRSSNHAAYSLFYHVIFCTKYRHKAITAQMLARLEQNFRQALQNWGCSLVEFGGESDHVHLLVEAKPSLDLSRLIGSLKTSSARLMRKDFSEHLRRFYWKPYFWSKSYAVLSVGGRAPLESLLRYIQNQDAPKS